MRTIRKSDVIFNLDTKHVYVQDFNAKFFTVNEKDYFIEYSSADVVTTEKEGEIIYSLNLDWKRLRNVGKGVLVFKCINNIPDEDFPDGSYNSEYKITTDYFIDTFEVEPEEHESVVELIEEETENRISGDTFLSGAIDAVDAKVEDYKQATNTAVTALGNALQAEVAARTAADTDLSTRVGTGFSSSSITDVIVENEEIVSSALNDLDEKKLDASAYTPTDLSNYYTKSETSGKTEIQTALSAKVNVADVVTAITPSNSGSTDPVATCVVAENEEVVASALTDLNARKLDASAYTPTDLSNYYTKSETSGKTEIQTALAGKANTATTYTKSEVYNKTEVDDMFDNIDLSDYYTKEETDGIVSGKVDLSYVENVEKTVARAMNDLDARKQNTLVSGTNIKTINNESILGSGNIDIQGGGSNVISLTQAEYDALETIDPDALYVISDAVEVDMSNYYTKSQTNTLVGGKQDTLVSGTNIKTINNESILGSGNIDIQGGGGKAVSGGTNISITTGETADTINCTLPISADTNSITINKKNIRFGNSTTSNSNRVQFAFGDNCSASGIYSMAMGAYSQASNYSTFAYGHRAVANNNYQTSFGRNPLSNVGSSTFGDSGNTLFCIGNATRDTDDTRHNAFEIRQNGDIYITLDGSDVKLQDQLGGGSSYTAGEGIDITNDVISVTGKVDTTAITTSVTSASTDSQVPSAKAVNDKLGGLSLVKLTQAEYDALETKDPNTLYIIDNSKPTHDYSKDYLTFVVTTGGNIGFSGSTAENTLSYSKDNGETWNTADSGTTIPVAEGDKVLWKGTPTPQSNKGIGKFSGDTTARYSVEGNAMSLLFGDDFKNQTSLEGKNYALTSLFYGNTNVTGAENMVLPATTLSERCYHLMFGSCSNLTTAPELPATTLANSCYYSMFQGCRSLTTAPSVLPATTLAESCYQNMFYNCSSLTAAPELPATTLADNCYSNMFQGCTSLTTAPSVLPATTLAFGSYRSMFSGCTSLTTAPELPAPTLAQSCYNGMFYGCTSLNSITCLATDISATLCTDGWVSNVAASGTFTKAAGMTSWTTGTGGIPSGWTVVDKQ